MSTARPHQLADQVQAATTRRDQAAMAWRAAIRNAHTAGLPITEIARAAGQSRPTIYRVLAARS